MPTAQGLLEWVISLFARFLSAVGVQPTYENMVVVIAIVMVILVGILLLSWESNRYRQPRKATGPKPSFRPNETNNLVAYGPSYPFIYRLTSEDGTQGWYVKKENGAQAWLSIKDSYYSVLTMRTVMENEILAAEQDLAGGDVFSLRGARWKLEKRLTFGVEAVAGTTPSFTALEYFIASNEHGDMTLIENPFIPNKPTKLRTWTQCDLSSISQQEFNLAVGEILDSVKA